MEELNVLPYLENVIRETLLAHTPLVSVTRVAMWTTPFRLAYRRELEQLEHPTGVVYDSLPITEGQEIYLSLLAVNTDKALWEEDAAEFNRSQTSDGRQKALFILIRAFKFELAIPAK
ncbi:hypothetical protein B0H14DRAFT_2591219 [Mycena olivaceomarginata]|nr:hypothetical protein B0H14DRAFT_2591219 [Mycena olivaceomarginata]